MRIWHGVKLQLRLSLRVLYMLQLSPQSLQQQSQRHERRGDCETWQYADYTVCQKSRTPVTFWYNCANTALMSVIPGMENLNLILN